MSGEADGPEERGMPGPTAPEGPPATERVLAGYCHDLNGQLASALGWLSLLGPDTDTGGPHHQLRASLDRIEELVRELRWLVRDPTPAPVPTSLADLLQTFESTIRQHPRFHRVVVERSGPDDLPAVRIDFASTLRVLLLAADALVEGDAVRSLILRIEEGDSTVRLGFEPASGPTRTREGALEREARAAGIELGTDADGRARWVELPRLG